MSNLTIRELQEVINKKQNLISNLVARIENLESKVNAQQRLLNILVFRAQESIFDLNETELDAMVELAENLKREGIELNV